MDKKDINRNWQSCLQQFQLLLPQQQFRTWLQPLEVDSLNNGELRLSAPNQFIANWVRQQYIPMIRQIANQVCGVSSVSILQSQPNSSPSEPSGRPVFRRKSRPGRRASRPYPAEASVPNSESDSNYSQSTKPIESDSFDSKPSHDYPEVVHPDLDAQQQHQQAKTQSDDIPDLAIAPLQPTLIGIDTQESAPSSPMVVDEPVDKPAIRRVPAGLMPSQTLPRAMASAPASNLRPEHQCLLNSAFTFESFVIGKSNQLATAAAQQVAANPGAAGQYNPLFIYGGVGLGKTHLMQAVGNEIIRVKPDAKVLYLRSERFVADMVKALQLNAMDDFKRYYRSMDALLIDDIQFFAGKDRTQEEFFHTFNALLEGGQQVIVTSDRYPKEIKDMEDRLRSRFEWGLTVAVEPPELETRVAILMTKAAQQNMTLPDDAAFFIANRIRSHVRELEGALTRVIAHARFVGRDIDVMLIREALKDLLAIQQQQVSVDNIQKVVADYYRLSVKDLLSRRRTRNIARPRQIAMALSKELTSHSLPEIGDQFGGRDHTTVLHACRVISKLAVDDSDVKRDYEALLRSLTS